MSNKAKPSKFSRRYETFLSEASNEEIVSISKELAEEMNAQIKSTAVTALTLLGISMGALILSISLVTDLAASIASSIKNMIFLMRMISIAFMCITALIAFLVIQKVNKASSFSPLMWRHIRETASDETAYEQMDAVRSLDFFVSSAKNLNVTAALTLVLSGIFLGFSYIYQMMAASGYL